MPARWTGLWAMLKRTGQALPWARSLAAVIGLLIMLATVVVFIRHVWHEPMSEMGMVYVFGFVLVGLALLTIGGKSD